MSTRFEDQPESSVTPHQVARHAVALMDGPWSAFPGPMGMTGHLRHDAAIPFTVGVCGAGDLYVRNDESGASAHLPVSTTADLDTFANALCDVIGDLL